jgi:urease accessory protein
MFYLTQRLGNIHTDPDLFARVTAWKNEGKLEEVTLEEREARKTRLRLFTNRGRELGLILSRDIELAAGDVFALEGEDGAVLVSLAPQEVMVLILRDSVHAGERLQWAVRLGHVLGNQHWPVAVVGTQVLTPVTLDRAVMETVLKTHHLTEHFTIHYEQRSWPRQERHESWTTPH